SFFFFSSRRRHTRFSRDWSSDVCSSDLGIYEETKADGERLALELGAANGVEVTALRPTPVYGPGDTRLLKLFKLASRRPMVTIGDGKAGYHLVYIEDLTDAFILAASEPAAAGEAFLIGGPE